MRREWKKGKRVLKKEKRRKPRGGRRGKEEKMGRGKMNGERERKGFRRFFGRGAIPFPFGGEGAGHHRGKKGKRGRGGVGKKRDGTGDQGSAGPEASPAPGPRRRENVLQSRLKCVAEESVEQGSAENIRKEKKN